MYKTWAQMEALVDQGLVKSIGVSNFNIQLLWDMLTYARIKPVVNEVELHPLNTQLDLVKFMHDEKVIPIGYCPIARGADTQDCPNVCEHEIVKKLQQKYNKTGAQILLNWGKQRGHILIPKSNSLDRIQENLESMDFDITEEEVNEINTLNANVRICDKEAHVGGLSIFA